jgi:ABC-type polysaccharide/polyol phosphate export permease
MTLAPKSFTFLFSAFFIFKRDLAIRFNRTFFGLIWFFISALFLLILSIFINISVSGATNYSIIPLLFLKIIFWQLFTDSWNEPLRFQRRAKIFMRNSSMNVSLIPFAGLISSTIIFLLRFVLFIFFALYFNLDFNLNYLFLLITFAYLAIFGYSLGLLLSSTAILLNDVRYITPLIQLFLLLITPVFIVLNLPEYVNTFNPLFQSFINIELIIGSQNFISYGYIYSLVIILIFFFSSYIYKLTIKKAYRHLGL